MPTSGLPASSPAEHRSLTTLSTAGPRNRARRGTGCWAVLVAVGAVFAVSTSVTACSTSRSATTAAAPTQAQAQVVLDGLAHDVLGHNTPAYLAALDPVPAAASFRSGQRSDLNNLAAVPLASWSYHVDSVSHDATATAAASRRLGSPTLIVGVSLRYAFQAVDLEPTRHDLWLTFTRNHGRTYLAGDDDLAAAGFASWAGPWHYGPLASARGASSLVLGPAGNPALLHLLATEVDAAVPAVSRVWGTGWSQQVAVIVPSTTAEFTALLGTGVITDISAAAATDGIDPVTGRAYGQRLILNPTALDDLSAVGRRIVLRHEITHLASAASTSDVTPRWLVEGFAEYVGNLGSGQPVITAAAELAKLVRSGHVPAALPDATAFATSGVVLAQAYEESWLACRLIASLAGQPALVRLYRMVGTAITPSDEALAAAMGTILHESVAVFTAQWRAYVQTQLS
jgi:hypothetical protein